MTVIKDDDRVRVVKVPPGDPWQLAGKVGTVLGRTKLPGGTRLHVYFDDGMGSAGVMECDTEGISNGHDKARPGNDT